MFNKISLLILCTTGFLVLSTAYVLPAPKTGYKDVYIKWKSVEGAVRYKIEIKKARGGLVLEQISDTVHANLRLKQGKYKMRLGAMNKFHKVDSWSKWSNISITIKNPPEPPCDLESEKIFSKDGKELSVKLTWEPPEEKAKDVKNYSVFMTDGGKKVRIGQPRSTEFLIEGLDPEKRYKFEVLSMNKQGEESVETIETTISKSSKLNIYIMPCFILPDKDFKDLFNYGAGLQISFAYENVPFKNLYMSLIAEFHYLYGKNYDLDIYAAEAGSSSIAQARLALGYRFYLSDNWSISAEISGGYSYHSLKYTELDVEYKNTFYEPAATAGAAVEYDISNNLRFHLGFKWGLFIEAGNPMSYYGINIGICFVL